jgi:hypothetical protein
MTHEPRISRRLFLHASTFAGAGAAIAGGLLPLHELEAGPSGRYCFSPPTTCAWPNAATSETPPITFPNSAGKKNPLK